MSGSQSVFLKNLDANFPNLMKDYGTTAAVALVITNGHVVYQHAWGRTADGPVMSNSVFGTASISKLATAWGVMTLVDRGLLDLDASVLRYLTEAQIQALPFDPSKMTIRQLLSHTSGLSGRSAKEFWRGDKLGTALDDLTEKTSTGAPRITVASPPGTSWAYSGAGYALLQIIVENVSKKSFSAFMADAVFRPLGMRRTYFGNPEFRRHAVVEHFDEGGLPIARLGYNNLAAAGLYTTLADFRKLVEADLDGGRPILNKNGSAIMESAATGSGGKYGLGYFVERLSDQEKVVGHDGSDVGWNSMYRLVPSRKSAIVMFTNNSLGIAAYFPVMCGWYRSLGSDRTDYCAPLSQRVIRTLFANGESAAIGLNRRLEAAYGDKYHYDREYWNYIGYQMISRKSHDQSVQVFRLNTTLFPDWANGYDSLGDGYRASGDNERAIASYRRAIALDPKIESARRALGELTQRQ